MSVKRSSSSTNARLAAAKKRDMAGIPPARGSSWPRFSFWVCFIHWVRGAFLGSIGVHCWTRIASRESARSSQRSAKDRNRVLWTDRVEWGRNLYCYTTVTIERSGRTTLAFTRGRTVSFPSVWPLERRTRWAWAPELCIDVVCAKLPYEIRPFTQTCPLNARSTTRRRRARRRWLRTCSARMQRQARTQE